MAHVIVTGGAGFIGSHVVDALIAAGYGVVVIDDLSTGRRENLNPAAEFVQTSIRDAGMAEAFSRHRFDAVIHLAAQIDVRKSVADPVADADTNILGSLHVLEASVRAGIGKFIFLSTGGAIYGETEIVPTPEHCPAAPLSPYGAGKLAIEQYLNFYRRIHGVDSTVLRLANVYGPRQNPEGEAGVVSIFLSKLLKGEPPVIYGDGRQTRDYVYVQDVVAAVVRALDAPSGTFNIGTGRETSVNELFERIASIGGFSVPQTYGPARPGEQQRSCLDGSAVARAWDFHPRYSLDQGLKETADWFREKYA